jgi:hypothetical protein
VPTTSNIARNAKREQEVADGLRRASRFYRFLWEIRDELFADGFEEELMKSYLPRGQEPCPPAMLAMVMLLQRYEGIGDADAVETAENDRRWQLVLGTLDIPGAPFGQGTLFRFRMRMIAHDLDKKLVKRTVELAKKTGKFGWKNLRVALDSSPLEGAGRVEDTWNLIGRAMTKVVGAVASALGVDETDVVREANLSTLSADSVKAALDIDWDDEDAQQAALRKLLREVSSLETWVKKRAMKEANDEPLKGALVLLKRVAEQDTEPDPGGGGPRIKEGVAEDRIVSVSDTEMRHGRKSRSKRFDGYKRHIAIANGLVLSTAVEPANKREYAPASRLLDEVAQYGVITTLDIDRGYLPSPAVERLHRDGAIVHSRAWQTNNDGFFTKEDFMINLRRRTVTCPNNVVVNIGASGKVAFPADTCGACPIKNQCTRGARRSLSIHRSEALLIEFRRRAKTRRGRRELRRRVVVEHSLARISAIQGRKARYVGVRKNELDLNRAAAIVNLFEVARLREAI